MDDNTDELLKNLLGDEETNDIVTLKDENGKDTDFIIIDGTEVDLKSTKQMKKTKK